MTTSGLMFPLTVTLHLPAAPSGRLDRYNQPILDPPTDLPSPAWFEPRSSSEDVAAREQYVSGYWLLLPLDHPGAPLPGDAEVTLPLSAGPTRFGVEGEPGEQPGGAEVEGFVRVALERTSG